GFTMPAGGPDWHAPGLKLVGGESLAGVVKLPSLNCSTIVNVVPKVNTVKCRLKRSFAQSFPHVPESVEPLAYGPLCCVGLVGGSTSVVRSVVENNCASPV